MSELLAVAAVTILAVVSPGPDFAMVTRNSYAYGARAGLMTAVGIACGVQVHVLYTLLGLALLIVSSPSIFFVMKLLGAGYLVYLGLKSLLNTKKLVFGSAESTQPSLVAAFGMGFLTNALNPKTMLFVVATYSQVVQSDSPVSHNVAYGFFMSIAHWVWFSIVALFFSKTTMRQRMLAYQGIVDKSIGLALIGLGASLVFVNVAR